MIKKILVLLLISLLIATYGLLITHTFAQEEKLTITTYYPSPYGSYRELTAYRMKIGRTFSGSGYPIDDDNFIVEGKVGIGTNMQGENTKVRINGPTTVGSRTLTLTDAAGTSTLELGLATQSTAQRPYIYANTNLAFGTNGAERMVLNSAGNVGIGTESPARLLNVSNTTLGNWPFGSYTDSFKVRIDGTGANGTGVNGDSTAIEFFHRTAGVPQTAGAIGAITENAGAFSAGLGFATTSGGLIAERVRISNTGNVGIGTASPTSKLQVESTDYQLMAYFQGKDLRGGASPDSSSYLALKDVDASGDWWGLRVGNAGDFAIHQAGVQDRLTILSNGNVGIGTAAPVAKLDVAGKVKLAGGRGAPPGSGSGNLGWGGGFEACTIGTLWVEDNGTIAQLCFCGRRSGGAFKYCW